MPYRSPQGCKECSKDSETGLHGVAQGHEPVALAGSSQEAPRAPAATGENLHRCRDTSGDSQELGHVSGANCPPATMTASPQISP